MEFTGEVIGITRDWETNKFHITFSVNEPQAVNEVHSLKNEKLTVKAVKYRKKRSLDANNYAWQLMSKLAETFTPPISKDECYELMLQHYGTNEVDENGNIVVISVLANIDVSKTGIHLACIGQGHIDGKTFNHYRVIKGSSEYNTKEMSLFIDGIVSECKDAGIETLTADELAKMKNCWGVEK